MILHRVTWLKSIRNSLIDIHFYIASVEFDLNYSSTMKSSCLDISGMTVTEMGLGFLQPG